MLNPGAVGGGGGGGGGGYGFHVNIIIEHISIITKLERLLLSSSTP